MFNKTLKYTGFLILGFLLFWGCEELLRRKVGGFAGSYPFVEPFTLLANEQEIIEAIKELSKTNPNFHPPENIPQITERDSSNEYSYWLNIKLYYPDTQEIVHTWTRPEKDKDYTTFSFFALSNYDHPTDYRLINRDFWFLENKREISRFKTTFVDEIKKQIDTMRKIR